MMYSSTTGDDFTGRMIIPIPVEALYSCCTASLDGDDDDYMMMITQLDLAETAAQGQSRRSRSDVPQCTSYIFQSSPLEAPTTSHRRPVAPPFKSARGRFNLPRRAAPPPTKGAPTY
jgi:hypothetical protein